MRNCKSTSKRILVSISILSVIAASCEKDSTSLLKLPTIQSSEIFSLSSNAITIKSTFSINSKDSIEKIGHYAGVYSLILRYIANFTSSALNDSIMYSRIEGLEPNTKNYARVYASNIDKEAYGPEIEFTTNSTVVDIEGNIYNTVTIGNQTWMVENLKVTKYNDGSDIPFLSSNTNWPEFDSPRYSWYDYNIENKNPYGALYNWPAVNSGKLCPEGWHIPTDSEWSILANYLGGELSAGGFLKSTSSYWVAPNYKATNYSGFWGVPAGCSAATVGSFDFKGILTVWWSSTISNSGLIITRKIWNDNEVLYTDGIMSASGTLNYLSVRCIKD